MGEAVTQPRDSPRDEGNGSTPSSGRILGPVRLGAIAHGGSCVARLDARVVFVRHGIPGETVTVRVVDETHPAWWVGEVDAVLEPSPDRVVPRCPVAGRCGGCDFQHIALPRQRVLKSDVVADLLRRFAHLDVPVSVAPVAGDHDGEGWRTRVRYLVHGHQIGLRAWRSHAFVGAPATGCALADPRLPASPELVALATDAGAGEVGVAVDDLGQTGVWAAGRRLAGPALLTQRAAGHVFQVRPDGFWQVHPGAAAALVTEVLDALHPAAGQRAWDLYSGVGLFAAALLSRGVAVGGVEQSREAVTLARRNVAGASFVAGRVERVIGGLDPDPDLVVLDPPRSGAGRAVVEAVIRRRPAAIAYVACDPATLARDVQTFVAGGYRLDRLRALDAFPLTHHVECVARLVPA